jgi:hypothetical protein
MDEKNLMMALINQKTYMYVVGIALIHIESM